MSLRDEFEAYLQCGILAHGCHVLIRAQLEQIGTPDVLMIPIDGFLNLDYPDIIRVITQLQPRLVIPMHIESASQAETFVRYTDKRYSGSAFARPDVIAEPGPVAGRDRDRHVRPWTGDSR